jgi:chemotaxis regulatin CheY-phosphate phosphatase CheZ
MRARKGIESVAVGEGGPASGEPSTPAPEAVEKLHAWVGVMKAVQEPASEAFTIIHRILERLLASHQVLEESGAQKLQHTNVKLLEVSSATESAAMDIMDGVGRALELVDRLEAEQSPSGTSGQLRDELFEIMNHLQFQDVTTQQLQYTSTLLQELESELIGFVHRLEIIGEGDIPPAAEAPGEITYNPLASMRDASSRQAAADALLRSQKIA